MMSIEDNLGFVSEGLRGQVRCDAIALGAISKMLSEGAEDHAFYVYLPKQSIQLRDKERFLSQEKSAIIFTFSGSEKDCQSLKDLLANYETTDFQKGMGGFVARRQLVNKSQTGKALKKAASMFFVDAKFDAEAVEEFLADRYQVCSLEELSLMQLEDLINQF